MSKIYNSFTDLIGKTPLLRLNNFMKKHQAKAEILAKLEYFNPAGSIKDRIAQSMIAEAEKSGLLKPETTIIEPTSGNTGIGLAAVAAAKGYKAIFTMPETMSIERRKLLQAYGAEIVLTEGGKGMKGAIDKAKQLNKENENSILMGQFINPANPQTHYKTTGPEIWEDCNGQIDIFIAGIGTGGTISGAGQFLKEKNPEITIIGFEPSDSPVLSQGKTGPHKIQGIGAGFITQTLNTDIYDKIVTVENENAFIYAKSLARTEGILVGISSGAALYVALQESQKEENKNKTIVTILPDTGERYLSTELF